VTPISGESWINHLHRSFDVTSMGKTGRLGPPPDEVQTQQGWQNGLLLPSSNSSRYSGADLYRINCEGCHKATGQGFPPEINSLIDPVRATSVALVLKRMQTIGMPMTPAAASELAGQAQAALLQRLHNGGQSMPPFPQLTDAEIRALLAYLRQLANVPSATQLTVEESPVRIGELIVKSTCHICHDATGANPTPEQLEYGAIPPLETLTFRTDQIQLIRKVTAGAPVEMGSPPTPHRGRMPVFYYLSRDEASDVFLYLTSYPPSQIAARSPAVAGTQSSAFDDEPPVPPATSAPPKAASAQSATPPKSDGISDGMVTLLLLGLGAAVLGLLVCGVGYCMYELQRLGRVATLARVKATKVGGN
jgi:mono/diheme cytochrome c family protein